MLRSILALLLISVMASSHAATAWKSDEVKDNDGNVICVYAYKSGHIYTPAEEFVGICPITIDVEE